MNKVLRLKFGFEIHLVGGLSGYLMNKVLRRFGGSVGKSIHV